MLCAWADAPRATALRKPAAAWSSLPRLICFDENLESIEWEMPWSLAVEIKLKENPKEFTVSDGNQKAKFLDVLGNAARWKAAMGHTQISDGTGSAIFELVKSDDYQPETMLRFQGSLIKRSIHTEAGSALTFSVFFTAPLAPLGLVGAESLPSSMVSNTPPSMPAKGSGSLRGHATPKQHQQPYQPVMRSATLSWS